MDYRCFDSKLVAWRVPPGTDRVNALATADRYWDKNPLTEIAKRIAHQAYYPDIWFDLS